MESIGLNLRKNSINRDLVKLLDDYANCDLVEKRREEYFGIVVDNNDPEKLGRCKVRVYNYFDPTIPDSDIPWALPDFHWVGSLNGSFVVPPVGAIVTTIFDHGDIYHPIYVSKGQKESSLPATKDTNYPDNMVLYTTDAGEYFSVNRSTKESIFHHSSGTEIKIDGSGNVSVQPVLGAKISINGDGTSVVNPDQIKYGPMCSLPFCLYTGTPHQGNTAYRVG